MTIKKTTALLLGFSILVIALMSYKIFSNRLEINKAKETAAIEEIYEVFNELATIGYNYKKNEFAGICLYDKNKSLPFVYVMVPPEDSSIGEKIMSTSFWIVDFNGDVEQKNIPVPDNCTELFVDSRTLMVFNTLPVSSRTLNGVDVSKTVKDILPQERAPKAKKNQKANDETINAGEDDRKEIVAKINQSIFQYMIGSKINSLNYRIIVIDRIGIRSSYRNNTITNFVKTAKPKHYITVVIESKDDPRDVYCFLLESKTLKVVKMFDKNFATNPPGVKADEGIRIIIYDSTPVADKDSDQ